MRSARVTLLLAAALLVAAELVSLGFTLKGLSDHQVDRLRAATERAQPLLARIAESAHHQGSGSKHITVDAGIEPFDRLTIDDLGAAGLDAAVKRRLDTEELVAVVQGVDRTIDVLGVIKTEDGPKLFRLIDLSTDSLRFAADRTLMAQHSLILLAALIGFALAARARDPLSNENAPSLRTYEEAMARLRLRDDERLAAFEREKTALTSVLRDREAMARAGDLTAGIVHEVRNSVGAIAVNAKLAESAGEAQVRRAATAITEEVRTVQAFMTRFVDFIRNEKVDRAPFDLARLVARIVAREGANHQTRFEVSGPETRVVGDEDLLERAIENVVRNAGQAAGDAGCVWVKFGADATHAFVIVEDDGPGIHDTQGVLRPFESGRPGGLGLGLPLTLKLLGLHSGTLDLGQRASGSGTQAVCRWPLTALGDTFRNASSGPGA